MRYSRRNTQPKSKAMHATGEITYKLWTVSGEVKLVVHYGIAEGPGNDVINLGFIEIAVLDPQPNIDFSNKIDEEIEEIISECVRDYQTKKKDIKTNIFSPEKRPKEYLKACDKYDFSSN